MAISRPLGPLRAADTMEKMSDDPLPMAARGGVGVAHAGRRGSGAAAGRRARRRRTGRSGVEPRWRRRAIWRWGRWRHRGDGGCTEECDAGDAVADAEDVGHRDEIRTDIVDCGGEPEDQHHEPEYHEQDRDPGVVRQDAEGQHQVIEGAAGSAVGFRDLTEAIGILSR